MTIFQFIIGLIFLILSPLLPIIQLFTFLISGIIQTLYLAFNLPLCWHDWETIRTGVHRCKKCGGTIRTT